jgi:hypothetical protein
MYPRTSGNTYLEAMKMTLVRKESLVALTDDPNVTQTTYITY